MGILCRYNKDRFSVGMNGGDVSVNGFVTVQTVQIVENGSKRGTRALVSE